MPIREFGLGRHRAVDDTPAGGGAGMVMRADVLAAAIDHARIAEPDAPLIYLSPRGEPLTQALARELVAGPGVLLLAGRFEGVDERVHRRPAASARCRSAIMCCRAASSPPWCSSTRACACCPA